MMLSLALYLIGAVVVIAGLAWVATLLGAAATVVTGTAAVCFVIALILAAANRRAIAPPAA
jgi:hypothetical protein